MRPTSTYILAAVRYDGWVKIGRTTHVDAAMRIASCQTGNPRRLRLVACWLGDHEETLHKHFAPVRGCGEWFAMPSAAIADLERAAAFARGYVSVMALWPASRILSLGGGGPAEELADAFAPRTAHESHTGVRLAAL